MNDCAPKMMRVGYYALYKRLYAPRYKAIDLLLKTMEKPLTVSEAADALVMTEDAVRCMMTDMGVKKLDKSGFLTVMRNGNSAVCRLYQRQLAHGAKSAYDPSDIAYIYGLHERNVRAAFKRLGVTELPPRAVPKLLALVPVYVMV